MKTVCPQHCVYGPHPSPLQPLFLGGWEAGRHGEGLAAARNSLAPTLFFLEHWEVYSGSNETKETTAEARTQGRSNGEMFSTFQQGMWLDIPLTLGSFKKKYTQAPPTSWITMYIYWRKCYLKTCFEVYLGMILVGLVALLIEVGGAGEGTEFHLFPGDGRVGVATFSDCSPSCSSSQRKSLIHSKDWINICWLNKWHSRKINSVFSPWYSRALSILPSNVQLNPLWSFYKQAVICLTGHTYVFSYWMLSFCVGFLFTGERSR